MVQYSVDDFKRFFRLSRTTFEIILQNIGTSEEFRVKEGGRPAIPVETQLLVILWYLGNQEYMHSISDRFGITESTFIECRKRVVKVILKSMMSRFIVWPNNQERQTVIDNFYDITSFPGIVGALDATHIRIEAPHDHPQDYVNRKK